MRITRCSTSNNVSRFAVVPLFIACIASVHAELITINFEGTAIIGNGFWATDFAIDRNVTGSYSYDSSLIPTSKTSTTNTFLSNNAGNLGFAANWNMTFNLGSTTRTVTASDGLFNFGLFDREATSTLSDFYSFNGAGSWIQLSDGPNDNAAGKDAVGPLDGTTPDSAPDLSLFGGLKRGAYATETTSNYLLFNVTSLALAAPVSPTPEPEIYAMMALGMGVMGWAARRKKKRATVA